MIEIMSKAQDNILVIKGMEKLTAKDYEERIWRKIRINYGC